MDYKQENTDQLRFERASKRVKAIAGFYKHLAVYVVINIFVIAMRYFKLEDGKEFLTFSTFSTAFFWGIGFAFHALGVFGTNVLFGSEWEERKIKELMEKDQPGKWE